MDEYGDVYVAKKKNVWFYGLDDENHFRVYGPFYSEKKTFDHLNWKYEGWVDIADLHEGPDELTDSICKQAWSPRWGEPIVSYYNDKKAANYVANKLKNSFKADIYVHNEAGFDYVFVLVPGDSPGKWDYDDERREERYDAIQDAADELYASYRRSRKK